MLKYFLICLCVFINGCDMTKNNNLSAISSGYIGTSDKWHDYFSCISSEFNIDYHHDKEFEIEKIVTREQYLNMKFPKSYKDFIAANGVYFINELIKNNVTNTNNEAFFDVSIVDRFKKILPVIYMAYTNNEKNIYETTMGDSDYYVYQNYNGIISPDSMFFKGSRLNFIAVGSFDSEVYGFTEKEITLDGEMEAWYFSPDIGAIRYRSFAELMINYVYDILSMRYKLKNRTIADSKCSNILLDMSLLQSQFLDKK